MSLLDELLDIDQDTWRERSACRPGTGVDHELFFSSHQVDQEAAKRVCRTCPVVEECLDEALLLKRDGVWGATTEAERASDKYRERRARRPRQNMINESRFGTSSISRSGPAPAPAIERRPAGHMMAWLEAVKTANTGEWAVLRYPSKHSASAKASLLRTGKEPRPPGRWSFEGHVAGEGSELYVRYEGDDEGGS